MDTDCFNFVAALPLNMRKVCLSQSQGPATGSSAQVRIWGKFMVRVSRRNVQIAKEKNANCLLPAEC